MECKSYRKPYEKPVRANWWLSRKFYIFYMVRELTALFNLWVAVELTAIVLLAAFHADGTNLVLSLIQHPVAIVLNVIAFLGTCYHTYTWYKIFPIGVRIFTSRDPGNTKMVPRGALMASLYVVTLVASVIIVTALTLA